jgi:hypothetical protein
MNGGSYRVAIESHARRPRLCSRTFLSAAGAGGACMLLPRTDLRAQAPGQTPAGLGAPGLFGWFDCRRSHLRGAGRCRARWTTFRHRTTSRAHLDPDHSARRLGWGSAFAIRTRRSCSSPIGKRLGCRCPTRLLCEFILCGFINTPVLVAGHGAAVQFL